MPYIKQEIRKDLDELIDDIINCTKQFDEDNLDGIANYILTRLAVGIIQGTNRLRYKTIARLIGLFESAKLELYRKLAAPYEEKAIEKNGNIKEYGV